MGGNSLNIIEEKLDQLKKIIPEAFTEGKIDWEKLQATLGEDTEFKDERYVLNWAGKSEAFRVLQSPTTATLVPYKEESVDFDDTENIFIEGENLEVLKVLQKSYFGKIKMIYIDPPYNTGNDKFIYPDKFSEAKDEYLNRIGDRDESGYMTREGLFRTNSKDSGHYHSNWLSMMYPRLFLARNLLREDGAIFISIGDDEIHNLKLLLNEIFGEENFVASFVWKRRQNVDSRTKTGVSNDHEFCICYRKTEKGRLRGGLKDLSKYSNPDNDPRGDWMSADMTGLATEDQRPNLHYDLINSQDGTVYTCPPTGWRYEPKRMEQLIENGEIIFPQNKTGRPRRKKFLKDLEDEYTGYSTLLKTVFNTQGTRELRAIFDDREVLEFPKPKDLIKIFIEQGANNNSIILDFFAGSATTAHAVLDLNKEDCGNRKFIMVQLPEICDEKSEAFKAGYETIAEIGKERIRRISKKLKADSQSKLDIDGASCKQDFGFKVFKLQKSNFKIWRSDVKTQEELVTQIEKFTDPVEEKSKIENILYELLLKSGVQLTIKIEEKDGYYLANDGEIALILDKVNENIIKTVISDKPQKVITLDRLFKNNDPLKTNTVLQMKDAEIDIKVV
ncbi:MAG: site-specific DNA-methyltransferase [Candidatus Thermoplasmatota archaeon]|nr:site-specific DNA-methyltransferase [Candidatus Thermoplasmatota archaeon]